uniref:carbonyl reductase (NADPH) n=1 Tax=Arion vulgaris TaxID=1028688 RepID=A0A0B6YWA7_9EUPU
MAKRVAVVTGANKGLGLGIVKGLCKQFDGDVLLTARDECRGLTAIEALEKEGLDVKFHQLDVTDHDSIVRLRDFLKRTYGGLDILVNNAGVAFMQSSVPFAEQAIETVKINYFGALETSAILFPLLRPHARVCNVSSMAATNALKKCSPELKSILINPDITMEELSGYMTQFVQLAQDNKHLDEGFPDDAYGFSKIGMTVMSILQQKELDRQGFEDIIVNGCSPGFVATDMTNWQGVLTIDEGIITPLYCALLPPNIDSPRGLIIRLKEPVDWVNFERAVETK